MLKNLDQRGYIKGCVLLKEDPAKIHKKLITAYGNQAYSIRSVLRWVEHFKQGNSNLEDADRSGRSITAATLTNINYVHSLIEENRRISYSRLEELTLLSRGTLFTIVKNKLGYRKKSSRWVPHLLTTENKQRRLQFAKAMKLKLETGEWRLDQILTGDECIFYHRHIGKRCSTSTWKLPGEPPDTLVKRDRFEPKTMVCIFFKSTGPILIHAVEKNTTIDNIYYVENCLAPAFKEVEKQRPLSGLHGIKLLHDGARPHVHTNTRNFVESNGVIEIDHPPYSPDLAPCDFWLFDKIKQHLGDYPDSRSLVKAITNVLNEIPRNEYLLTFKKYQERLQYCIDAEGDYFEHNIK